MLRFSSSFRGEPLHVTRLRAEPFAKALGITRVTDITRLDRIGIPVFVSVRPGAQRGSLCVNSGKGATEEEAEVGAIMEAIEFAYAEYGTSHVRSFLGQPHDVLDGYNRPAAILDLCPLLGKMIDLDQPIDLVRAENVQTGATVSVPSELVFLPHHISPNASTCFGANSNGLASGNSVLEATVHGLLELMERDITSFQFVNDTSMLVLNTGSWPQPARALATSIAEAGFAVRVRTATNSFRLPYFSSILYDPQDLDPMLINVGYGCHIDSGIALTRSLCEAAQSRLSFIHGGRDDLEDRALRFEGWDGARRKAYCSQLIKTASCDRRISTYDKIAEYRSAFQHEQLEDVLDGLVAALAQTGLHEVCRVTLTKPTDPVQVVRMVVPGLEYFHPSAPRLGQRLRSYVEQE